MTVINMISLGKGGIAVADEQASNMLRKVNAFEKLMIFGDDIVYGGTGVGDMVVRIYDQANSRFNSYSPENRGSNVYDAYQITNDVLVNEKAKIVEEMLQKNVGISTEEIQTGIHSARGVPLDERLKEFASTVIGGAKDYANMQGLIGGIRDDNFEIYTVESSGPSAKSSAPYVSVGSGADASSRVLSDYFGGLPKKKRGDVPFAEGLSKLIEATNASSETNIGVGGIPSIVYVSKDGLFKPDEGSSKLATELVKGLNAGFLKRKDVYPMLESLVLGKETVKKIEDNMMSKARKPKKFSRFLRGYRD